MLEIQIENEYLYNIYFNLKLFQQTIVHVYSPPFRNYINYIKGILLYKLYNLY